MTRNRLLALLLVVAATGTASAAEKRPDTLERERSRPERHLLLRAEHALLPGERAALEQAGCKVLRAAGGREYIVAVDPSARERVSAQTFVAALESLPREGRIQPAARREAARFGAMARLNVVFHDDVSFDEARRLIGRAGGWLRSPAEFDFAPPRRLEVIVPDAALEHLAALDEVLLVDGPMPPIKAMNAGAAILSAVTPLHSAPYNLSGAGVTVAVSDPDTYDSGTRRYEDQFVDVNHQEFGGRVHKNGTSTRISDHATHVAGTIAAAGTIRLEAKGMAPGAAVESLSIDDDFLTQKDSLFLPLGIRADNNSWGYVHGWEVGSRGWEWYGPTQDDATTPGDDRLSDPLFGAYGLSTSALDKLVREKKTLIVYASANDGDDGGPAGPCFEHFHEDKSPKYCFSETGAATTSCPTTVCTGGYENFRHRADGPFGTVNLAAGGKNTIAVGAVTSSRTIAGFSARGPAQDGRVKPDIVAKGFNFSTLPGNSYRSISGTSMAAPVVTGIAALVIEQWRKTMGVPPSPETLRVLLIHGAEDLGTPGPDYTFGFGLVNARNSVDTIIADGGSGSLLRTGTVGQGGSIEYALSLSLPASVKLTLGWLEQEGVPYSERPLINDLDLKVIAPDGATILPFVLNPADPNAAAFPGVNSRDNIEQITFATPAAGLYRVQVTGTRIGTTTAQPFILVSSSSLGPIIGGCLDVYEPNDTAETAFGRLAAGVAITGRTCATNDVDFYRFVVDRSGPVSATVTATDTPLRLTLLESGFTVGSVEAEPGATRRIETTAGSGLDQPIEPITFTVRIEPTGALGNSGAYTLAVDYRSAAGRRQRITGR